MAEVSDRVIAIVSKQSGVPISKLNMETAVDQDLRISGEDVIDLAQRLADEFGEQIWQWPWQRFACLDEGLSLLFPFMLIWQLVTWPLRGSFEYPSAYGRLELGHIVAVIEKGEWFDP